MHMFHPEENWALFESPSDRPPSIETGTPPLSSHPRSSPSFVTFFSMQLKHAATASLESTDPTPAASLSAAPKSVASAVDQAALLPVFLPTTTPAAVSMASSLTETIALSPVLLRASTVSHIG